jgi:hypothetical protein
MLLKTVCCKRGDVRLHQSDGQILPLIEMVRLESAAKKLMVLEFKYFQRLIVVASVAMAWMSPCAGQDAPKAAPEQQGSGNTAIPSSSDQWAPGTVSGTVLDQSGAMVAGARVTLARDDQSPSQQAISASDGQFSFAHVTPGPFHLTITSAGFASQTSSGVLHSGEAYTVPEIALAVGANIFEVDVGLTQIEVAREQIQDEEKQRVLGFIPNFYVSYLRNPAPLTAKQKFGLAWKQTEDPVSFLLNGAIAGGEQALNSFSGYGQGAQGYGKRFGASYADFVAGTFIGGAILPSLLKQDPRYFYKGSGSKRSRVLYALASSVICKGDNRQWQANYSNILGSFAAGGISNIYYPASDRNGAGLTIENGLLGIGATGVANIFQEFVVRKLTRNVPKGD